MKNRWKEGRKEGRKEGQIFIPRILEKRRCWESTLECEFVYNVQSILLETKGSN